MNEDELRKKISGIRLGARVAVIPLSTAYGDDINAVGVPCADGQRSSIEITEPFYARLENFDGENLWLRTRSYYCLKVNISDVKDIMILASETWKDEDLND